MKGLQPLKHVPGGFAIASSLWPLFSKVQGIHAEACATCLPLEGRSAPSALARFTQGPTSVSALSALKLFRPRKPRRQTNAAKKSPQSPPARPSLSRLRQLFSEGRYQEILAEVPASKDAPPYFDLYRGLSLAKLNRWEAAEAAFEAGHAKQPGNERFLVELAGVDFRLHRASRAKADLRAALALRPGDSYARNFLAALYFLEGNLEAALENWNRIGQPRITALHLLPQPRLRNSLLERAFAFPPLGTLRLADLRATEARLANLGLFPRCRFDLVPSAPGAYAVDFLSTERAGWGAGKLDALASLFRDIPVAVTPEYYNLAGAAVNFRSYFRWDDNKRRVWARVSLPLGQDPRWRFTLYADARNENWNLSRTFLGASQPLAGLNMQRIELSPELRWVPSGRWTSQARVVYAYRRFRDVQDVLPQAAGFFTDGGSLEYRLRTDVALLRVPDRRLTLGASARGGFGKEFARGLGAFGRLEGSARLRWFPRATGDDYETSLRLRAGRFFGSATLDQLYQLGVERDNDLWMRGISGTHDGRKGHAPLGREFLLWNWETYKTIFSSWYVNVQLGPFTDIGRLRDPSGDFGSRYWLWDPGLECKFRLFGDVVVRVSYGRDLHSGSGAFYETASRAAPSE